MKKVLMRRILAMVIAFSMLSSIGLESFAIINIKAMNNKLYENQLALKNQDVNLADDDSDAVVIKKESDRTVMQLSNGMKRLIIHSSEVRFEKDGELVDYDPSFIKVENKVTENKNRLKGYKYENKQGNKKHYIPSALSQNTPILMEYQGYGISFYPVETTDGVVLDKENIENIYEESVTIPNKAIYQTKDGKREYEYVSEISGVKENIILKENPQTNILKYRIQLSDLTIKKNSLDEGFTLYDKSDSEKIVGSIDAPYMNDASNSAYSDNITTDLKQLSDGWYEITMELDSNYLNDTARQYPVIVDPTVSWSSSSQVYEPYVIKNSPYTDTNFYDSSVKVFAAGDGKQGVYRTYMKIPTLNDTLKGKYIENAELTVYETGSSEKGVEISAYRASEGWTVSTITWANRVPYDAGAISTFTTSGTTGASKKLDLTNYVRNTSNGTNTNWGFVLRAKDETEAGGFAQFYNSRYATVSKQPKLTVEYYDGPTTPTTATVEPKYLKQGSTLTAKWAGITAKSLNRIEFRVATYDDAAKAEIDPNYVPYSASTKIGTKGSGSAVIADSKNWPDNTYKFVIRGVDNGGIKGTGKGFIFYIDGTLPTLSSATISPTSTQENPSTEARPTITWKDAKDKFLKHVEYNVNGGAYKIAGTAASGSFKLPAADFTKVGLYTINIRAVDQAGNLSKVKTVKYYLGDASGDLNAYLPINLKLQMHYGKNLLTWGMQKELAGNVYYEIHRGTASDFVPSDSTLVADHVTNTYWSDLKVGENLTYYYKIKVVKNDANDNPMPSDIYTNGVAGASPTDAEYGNGLGIKSFLAYQTFKTPNGNGSVEKSKGNLAYSQTDMSIMINRIMFDFTRNYNSQSQSFNMLGKGWNDSFHKELYELPNGTMIFKDSDGSSYPFTKNADGSYKPAETKEFELSIAGDIGTQESSNDVKTSLLSDTNYILQEQDKSRSNTTTKTKKTILHDYVITTKNNAVYKFNQNGQIISMTEPYGNFLLYEYDTIGRLQSITANTGLQLILNYYTDEVNGANAYLLKSISQPDGTTLEYSYESGSLSKVTVKGKKGESVTYQYGYNSENRLSELYDGMGNMYSIDYVDNKVDKIVYPSGDYYTFGYDDEKTISSKYNNRSAKIFEEIVTLDPVTGKVIDYRDASGKISKYFYNDVRNPLLLTGTKEEIQYQALADDGTVLNYTKEVETLTNYNEDENVISETDEDGNTTNFSYESDDTNWNRNFPISMQTLSSDGQVLFNERYIYDIYGNPIQQENKNQKTLTENTYNKHGKIETSSVKLNDSVQSYASYDYDESGNAITQLEETGSIQGETVNTYDSMGRLLQSEDHIANKVTVNVYDFMGRVIETTKIAGGAARVEKMAYDSNGTLISKTKLDGVTESYTYDNVNRLISRNITKGLSLEYKTEYDYAAIDIQTGFGTKQIENSSVQKNYYKNDNGEFVVSDIEYKDAVDNLVRKIEDGILTDYTYNNSGNVLTEFSSGMDENSKGRLTAYLYNESGKQIAEIINPIISGDTFAADTESSIVTKISYDDAGNESSKTDANGITTYYSYDKNNRITKVNLNDEDGNSYEKSITYDIINSDNTISALIKDELERTSLTTIDSAGLTKEVKNLGDGSGNIASSFQYDKEGRKIKEIFNNGDYKKIYYNDIGLIYRAAFYTQSGELMFFTDYKYDVYDQLIYMTDRKLDLDFGDVRPYRHTYYEYDGLGRIVGKSEFNTLNQPSEEEKQNNQIRYIYNANNLLTGIIYPASTQPVQELHYIYDNYNRIAAIEAVLTTDGSTRKETIRSYSYNAEGEVYQITTRPDFAGGGNHQIVKTHSYDDFGRLTAIEYADSTAGGEILEAYTYAYDKNSNVIKETIKNQYSENPIEETKEYSYDVKGQLTKSETTNHKENDSVTAVSYEYDKVGNRTSMTENGEVTTYSYNGLDQLITSVTVKGTEVISNTAYTYDENGNQIKSEDSMSGTIIGYQYDVNNRLIEATIVANGKVESRQENLYNGDDQRIKKSVDGKVTNYFYSEGSVLYSSNDQGMVTDLNFYDLGGSVIASAKNSSENQSSYLTFHSNRDDSTTNLINQQGTAEVSYEYGDFGEFNKTGNSAIDNEFTYRNSVYDELTGLYYTNARYYNPETGRALTQDIVNGEKYNLNKEELYEYSANASVTDSDPTSRRATTIRPQTMKDISLILRAIGTWAIPFVGKIVITANAQIIITGIIVVVLSWLLYKVLTYLGKALARIYATPFKTIDQNKKNHILQPKHQWKKLYPDPGGHDWKKIVALINYIFIHGTFMPYKSGPSKVMTIKGFVVQVTYVIKNGVAYLGDAWIRK